jgi:hypothetical protein
MNEGKVTLQRRGLMDQHLNIFAERGEHTYWLRIN